MLFGFIAQLFSGRAQKVNYDSYPIYKGDDLGLTYTKSESRFKIWSPKAKKVYLTIYKNGSGENRESTLQMNKSSNGTWAAELKGDQVGKFYTFKIKIKRKWNNEVPDPYAKAVGVNGKRAMIIDLKETDPVGWKNDVSPVFNSMNDAVIYELHVRDASIAVNSNIVNKGKFIGIAEKGTKNEEGLSTGLDHIKELGVTHVHLLPSFDYYSVDESKLYKPQYNWGYDPVNFNVPEGSYSTDPTDGNVRINEFKKMVKTFHENGIRVVLDVAYNHTGQTEESNFNQLVPGYYYRHDKKGKFSNATACGNETASEMPMMRKFMLESVLHWVNEYHIDGFRFDLMGVHDIETMNLISKELHKIKPDILLYGEGWTAGASPLPDSHRALKINASKLDRIAVFSDDIRDGIKGSVFEHEEKGFVSGEEDTEESIKFGIVAATQHQQVDYSKVNYSKAPYATQPFQTISYASCHDNHTLWDKLAISAKDATITERKEMHKLALSIVLTSQGIPFLHAGTEFLRSKKGVENSFNSPDSINGIDWSLKTKNKEIFDYVKTLIALRKDHPAFRMTSTDLIKSNLKFREDMEKGVVGYTINGIAVKDTWKKIMVLLNGTNQNKKLNIDGKWNIAISSNKFSPERTEISDSIYLKPHTCSILFQ